MFSASFGPADAPVILLLHGGGVAGWMWDPVRDRLATEYRVVIVDLPGHGRSVDEPYASHAETVGGLARVLAEESPVRPAVVVGFSLGAQLAVLLAAEHPNLVDRAVVVSAQTVPLPFTGTMLALASAAAPLARRPWFARLQARELFIPPTMMSNYLATSAGITRSTLVASLGANLSFRIPEGWSRFPGAAMVMVGSEERRVMHDSADDLHEALPASITVVVDGCGHGIPLQRPEWFAETVAAFLA
ncbi:alpha/beta fold hydrolase [Microbacterium sp. NPDC090003]|uniref:alpha/beta fold hydrolase n=1 Tax=Microbacterium sp. NPDC090003 TaxID=3364203 RepID=UPI00382C103B